MTLAGPTRVHSGTGLNDSTAADSRDHGPEAVLILRLRLEQDPPAGRVALAGQEPGTEFNGWMGLMTAIGRLTEDAALARSATAPIEPG